jgi:hypothetical protein
MSEQPKELPPGGALSLDLALKDGESLLIIKRTADGRIEFPMFSSKEKLSGHEVSRDVARICREAIVQIEAGRN